MKLSLPMLTAAALVAMTGCAGARTDVVAPTASVPVSFSRTVRDASGALVAEDRRQVIGALDADGTAWGMLYSGIKLTPEVDVSEAVNTEVQRLRGDAVVNLTLSTRQCGWNWVPFLNVIPIWPGCARVHVHGDVIRVRGAREAHEEAPREQATKVPVRALVASAGKPVRRAP